MDASTLTQYKGYYTRPGTCDTGTIDELRGYRFLPITPDDVVLDIGGNIGMFAKYASGIAKKVISVEPEPENFQVLQLNSPTSENLNAAVVGDDSPSVTLYLNQGRSKGMHSILPHRGRLQVEVPAISFAALLAEYHPTKLKVDCEGAEYCFLEPEELGPEVTGVIAELHLTKPGQREAGPALCERFLACGFRYLKEPRFTSKGWHTLVCFER